MWLVVIIQEGETMQMKEDEDFAEELLYERRYLAIAFEIAKKQKMTKTQFAARLFPNHKDKLRRLNAMLGKTKTKRPQRLTLAEALRIAKTINYDFSSFCHYVRTDLEGAKAARELSGWHLLE